ncbi:thiamine pyrophosphate-binding protein [Ferviditalea candida]|uniref:Thiamine pyrophosphate-binding protein n=1 Tax=Ferviditalea candida TaxID=3108399 RepID=A0ABU5ZDK0_9BACL|nr:thiamine pyrophosphate-binding protein [Paenibacillaceae bacterium T2]
MRAIEIGLRFLAANGLKYVFGIPAGSINALYDALLDLPELKSIISKHETGAGYMATSYTRISGLPSLCVGSSGPGATNLVTAAANAMKEKLPVFFITGSVPTGKIGKGGAQELNALPLFESITKYNKMVLYAGELPEIFLEAYHASISGIPGPVHLSIPIDVQMTEIKSEIPAAIAKPAPVSPSRLELEKVEEHIMKTGNGGAVLLGHGAKSARSLIVEFAELTGWPVATTPRGKGAFPEDHSLSLGVYGLSGNETATEVLNGTSHDTLLVIGSSLGELATRNWDERLVEGKKLIHIDIDQNEIGKNFIPTFGLAGDAFTVLGKILEKLKGRDRSAFNGSRRSFNTISRKLSPYSDQFPEWNTKVAIQQIGACAPGNTRFYIDIGEMMTYSINNLCITGGQDFDIDINFGGMGSGIAGALGAKLAEPDRPVVCITGDGCFFMHGFEVLTAKEYNLPIVFVIINNARLGMVYHGHMMQYKRCLDEFSQPRLDIASLADSLGIQTAQIHSLSDLQPEHIEQWLSSKKPVIVEVVVEGNEIPPMGERVKFLEDAIF